MRIILGNKNFDTDKALHWNMVREVGTIIISGDLYRSSKGNWYMRTPSQWNSERKWKTTSIEEILMEYCDYFTKEDIEQITSYIDEWE